MREMLVMRSNREVTLSYANRLVCDTYASVYFYVIVPRKTGCKPTMKHEKINLN